MQTELQMPKAILENHKNVEYLYNTNKSSTFISNKKKTHNFNPKQCGGDLVLKVS